MGVQLRYGALLLFLLFPALGHAMVLRAGVPETLPGAELENGNLKLPGASGSVLPCIAKAFGVPLRWGSYPTLRLFKMIEHGELDLLYPMGFNAERDLSFQRSEIVLQSRDVWVFKDVRPRLEDKAQLLVAAKLGSPQADYLAGQGYQHVSLVPSYESLPRMLEAGRVQAIAVPGEGWDRVAQTLTWKASTETYLTREVGFYFSKAADPNWVARLNQAIKSCRE